MFATNTACGALNFGGGDATDSYDSTSTLAATEPVLAANAGNVGTNGNLTTNGNAIVNGSLSTPRTGVGNCNDGAVDALTTNGQATVTQGTIQLPQALSYPTPPVPNPLPPTGNVNASTARIGRALPQPARPSAGDVTVNPNGSTVTLGNRVPDRRGNAAPQAGKYNVNSIKLVGNSTLVVDGPPVGPVGPVTLNVAGQGTTTPIDFSGGSVQNLSYKPANFEILYAGTGTLKVSGGAATAAMVFAPNADVRSGRRLGLLRRDPRRHGVRHRRHALPLRSLPQEEGLCAEQPDDERLHLEEAVELPTAPGVAEPALQRVGAGVSAAE